MIVLAVVYLAIGLLFGVVDSGVLRHGAAFRPTAACLLMWAFAWPLVLLLQGISWALDAWCRDY